MKVPAVSSQLTDQGDQEAGSWPLPHIYGMQLGDMPLHTPCYHASIANCRYLMFCMSTVHAHYSVKHA
jgi:hypothetical protein